MLVNRFRTLFIFLVDLALAAISLPLAILLRLGTDGFIAILPLVLQLSVLFTVIAAIVLARARLHRVAWRFISVNDAMLVATTSIVINLCFLALMFFWTRLNGVPRASVLINIFLLTTLMIGCRLLLRLWNERTMTFMNQTERPGIAPVLLVGATDEAEAFILTTTRDRNAQFRVVGVIDTGTRPVGSLIRGITVMGKIADIKAAIGTLTARGVRPMRIIVADPRLRGETLREIVDVASSEQIKLNRLPAMAELQGGGPRMRIRPIEFEDLLRRDEATLDHLAMVRLVGGKRVLVTGAGGSIGSELVRQIAALGPVHVTLVDISEFGLYEIDRQLGSLFPALSRSAMLGDIRDAIRIETLFTMETPDLVFHAAALKHVPLLESQPAQAALTNVTGTRCVADACVRHNVKKMVMISTDKATNPISVMGASKRIAESYCQSLDIDEQENRGTRFVTVRFGNVLGSAGSVVPLFSKQLEAGGPLTVTHPKMMRYFMTIREAVELVLQAATLKDEEVERGRIVVLDMGEPINILDMAEQMIKLAGLQLGKDIDIVVTGLRPGERLTETLFQMDEELIGTSHRDVMVARPQVADRAFVCRVIDQLTEAAQRHDDKAVMEVMEVAVADFGTRQRRMADGAGNIQSSAAQYSEI